MTADKSAMIDSTPDRRLRAQHGGVRR
jgi:hypothetical protein